MLRVSTYTCAAETDLNPGDIIVLLRLYRKVVKSTVIFLVARPAVAVACVLSPDGLMEYVYETDQVIKFAYVD